MMASKSIVQRQRAISFVLAAALAHVQDVLPALAERLAPFLEEGETMPDFELVQRLVGRLLASTRARLVAADKDHLDELAGAAGPRRRRDDLVRAVRAKMIAIRKIVEGFFGPRHGSELIAVDGRIAEQPELLWRQAEHTVSRLLDAELPEVASVLGSVPFEPAGLAGELEPDVALRRALDAVELEKRNAESMLAAKRQ